MKTPEEYLDTFLHDNPDIGDESELWTDNEVFLFVKEYAEYMIEFIKPIKICPNCGKEGYSQYSLVGWRCKYCEIYGWSDF